MFPRIYRWLKLIVVLLTGSYVINIVAFTQFERGYGTKPPALTFKEKGNRISNIDKLRSCYD